MIPLEARKRWPHLKDKDFSYHSVETDDYNCISYSLGIETIWYWPGPKRAGNTWPKDFERIESLEAFDAFYTLFGFERCKYSILEDGFEKIALYCKQRIPTHAALQLRDGTWASKMGYYDDIIHFSLSCLAGGDYGKVNRYYKRPRMTLIG